MKNLFSIFTVALLLILTSCTKEELIIEEVKADPGIETIHLAKDSAPGIHSNDDLAKAIADQITVNVEASRISGGILEVDFSSANGFSEADLVNTQTLTFVNANGTQFTFTFSVDSFSYARDTLSVDFLIGGNNLSGLTLESVQYIIIEDEVVS